MNNLNKHKTLFKLIVKLLQDNDAQNYVILLSKLSYAKSFQEFIRYNKMFTTIAYLLNHAGLPLPEVYSFKLRRYRLYFEEAQKISDNLEHEGIEYSIIKTFSTIPKDISDIDLLVDREQRSLAEKILRQMGYVVRKESMEQNLFSKKVNNVIIDLELHTSIAASGYEYYDSQGVLRRSRYINGVKVPSKLDSILIIASHDIMKDLYIPLIHLIEAFLYVKYIDYNTLLDFASSQGLLVSLKTFLGLIEYISGYKFGYDQSYGTIFSKINLISMLRPNLTVKVPIILTLLAYLDNFRIKTKRKGLSVVIKQVLSLLNSKGINALLLNIPGKEPEVKNIWE